jgi:hypothetical protein
MMAKRKHSLPPRVRKKDLQATASSGDGLLSSQVVSGHFGILVETSIMSMREGWLRRKYMGVWSLWSWWIRKIMRALPTREVKTIVRIITKRTWWALVWLRSPRRMKPDVMFPFSMISNRNDTVSGETHKCHHLQCSM